MKTLEQKKKEALQREVEYSKLTPEQKLLKLNLRLGDRNGAIRERVSLDKQIQIQNARGISREEVIDERTGKPYIGGNQRKPYQKPKRS